MPSSRPGVLLVSLGTPEAPTPAAVRRFLREFLSDPRVVELPRALWLPLLYLVILPLRSAKTARKYASIWMNDASPLRVYALRQAQLLRGYLGERSKAQVPVVAAMRYGEPSVAAGLAELATRGCDRVLVLPMYPQYAGSTTASVGDALKAAVKKMKGVPTFKLVRDFHEHPAYIKAIAKNVNDYWFKHGRPDRRVMSFHGIPRASVERGDPYEKQCRRTAELIAAELGWNDARTRLAFQSRFGKAEWLQPYTLEVLRELGTAKTPRVDVICPGFAADCLETLEEIAAEAKAAFKAAGGLDFHYIPTTNDTPAFIGALAALAQENLDAHAARPLDH